MTARQHRARQQPSGAAIALVGAAVMMALSAFFGFVLASPVNAAVPGGAPPNPSQPCTWNWNQWSQPGAFAFPYTDSSFDPTQAVFSQVSTALGANGWYAASSGPQFSHSGLREGVGPAEATTGANDSEWSYGVGYYVMAPGTRQSVTIRDADRQESHAFALYDSAGNQFSRYPTMADVNRGIHYVASEQEPKSNPALAGGLARANSWSQTISFTVPSDGKVYIHYLNFDERIRTQFASFSGACGPIVAADSSENNVPARSATVNVLANDSNVVAGSVQIVGATAGTLVVPEQGTWRAGSDGQITFVPEAGFVGDPAPIRYTAADSSGKRSGATSVSVDYQPVFATPDESPNNTTGERVVVDVTANDSNVDARSITLVGADPSGRVVQVGRGVWSVNRGAGTIEFAPEPDVEADPRPIRYAVNDVGGNALTPVQVAVLYSPIAEPDESLENIPGDDVAVNVAENDPSFDIDPESAAISEADPSGQLVVEDEGVWSVDPETGEIVFSPEGAFAGDPESIAYTISDVDGNVSLPVELVVDYLPVTRDDMTSGHPAGSIITLDVLGNDPSNDLDPATVSIADPRYDPTTRTLVVADQGTWTVDAATGAITVTPLPDYLGEPLPIAYTVEDDEGNVSELADLVIEHLPLPVVASDWSERNQLGESVVIDVLSNDPTSSLDPTTVQIIGADSGTGELVVVDEGTWTVDPATGAITFNPEPRFDHNPTPIQYFAADALGVTTEPAAVTVTYFDAVPETLAFVEPSDIDWGLAVGWGMLAGVLLVAGRVVVTSGRKPMPATLQTARTVERLGPRRRRAISTS